MLKSEPKINFSIKGYKDDIQDSGFIVIYYAFGYAQDPEQLLTKPRKWLKVI